MCLERGLNKITTNSLNKKKTISTSTRSLWPTTTKNGVGMKPRIKNHFRAHQLSIWLRLIPELHRAGMEDVITRHNLFKNHDDMDLYDGPVKLDSMSRLAFLEETFKQRRNNGTNNEYSLLNINGKCL